jgi:hypothetical protein
LCSALMSLAPASSGVEIASGGIGLEPGVKLDRVAGCSAP